MREFTPGPWEVITEYMKEKGYEGFVKRQAVVRREKGEFQGEDTLWTIAEMNWSNPVEANAHLIAAAPEMYEALSELVDLVEGIISGDYKPDSFTTQPGRKALTKAEGRQE